MPQVVSTIFKKLALKIFATGVGAYASAVISGVIVGAAVIASSKAIGKMMMPSIADMFNEGITIQDNSPSNTAPIPVIYGRRTVGGTRIFMETTGVDSKFLHYILLVAEGEVTQLNQVYINGTELYNANGTINARFRGGDLDTAMIKLNFHLGTDNQLADQDLIAATAKWNSNMKLSGLAYAYIRLEYDTEVWSNGLPIITFDVLGKKVRDIRNTTDDALGLLRHSTNPALCLRDFLINDRYGRSISASEIDDASFIIAANYCDEEVIIEGNTHIRYEANGVVNVSQSAMETVGRLLTSCRGFLVYTGGKYKIVLDKIDSSTFSFDEDNMIEGVTIAVGSKSTIWNRCKTVFFNKDKEWQTDYSIQESTAYRTADNGLVLEGAMQLPFTSNSATASMIARQSMNQSRESMVVTFRGTIDSLQVECGDVISITSASMGWTSKKFRVLVISMEALDEINFTAKEYNDDVYSMDEISLDDTSANNTDLPDPSIVNRVSGLGSEETLFFNDPIITNRLTLSWVGSTTPYASSYRVFMRKGNPASISNPNHLTIKMATRLVGKTQSNQFVIDNLETGVYHFMVQTVSSTGAYSLFRTLMNVDIKGTEVLPDVNPPAITSIVESLYITTTGTGVKAKAIMSFINSTGNTSWENLGVEISEYEVQFKLSTEDNWTSGFSTGVNFEFFDLSSGIFNFRIRAINDARVKSDWAEGTEEIYGLTSPPANVTEFYIRYDSQEAHLTWKLVGDRDVEIGGHYEIRHSSLTSSAKWKEARVLKENTAGKENGATVPLLVGTYLIKAVDSSGNKSTAASSIINNISPSLFAKTNADSQTESNSATAWAGTKTDMEVDSDGDLSMSSAVTLDEVTVDIDTLGSWDSLGTLVEIGSYEFNDDIDFGYSASVGLRSELSFTVEDINELIDNRVAYINTWASFDDEGDFDDVKATLFFASTNDDPDSSPTWSEWTEFTIGSAYGRAFKFKIICTTEDSSHQIKISEMKAILEAWYRTQSDRYTTTTSAFTVTYDDRFKGSPNIAIAAQNMSTGDYYSITSTSATGFTIQFFNSSSSGIARTFDYLSRGY